MFCLNVMFNIALLLGFVAFCAIIYLVSFIITKVVNKVKNTFFSYKLLRKRKLSYKDVPMFRDLVCKDNYGLAYFIMIEYSLIDRSSNYIGALILKWICNNNLKIKGDELEIVKQPEDSFEQNIYSLLEASTVSTYSKFVDLDKFKKECTLSYHIMKEWFDDYFNEQFDYIKNNKEYVIEDEEYEDEYAATDKLDDMAERLLGLKKFFNEFTYIDERDLIEVKLWKEYLIYAQMFGLADKVYEKLKIVFEDVIDPNFLTAINYFEVVLEGIDIAISNDHKSDSGNGGGFSFGGGGGGSFGGGGGGGGFR